MQDVSERVLCQGPAGSFLIYKIFSRLFTLPDFFSPRTSREFDVKVKMFEVVSEFVLKCLMSSHGIYWECLHFKGWQPPTQPSYFMGIRNVCKLRDANHPHRHKYGRMNSWIWIGHFQKMVPFITVKSCIQGLNNTSTKFHFGISSKQTTQLRSVHM